ncbi:unnamed protein product [Bursaphelenchus xylophilus]|uniref:(pine wood nematode) hypothetical protein n=1 Tax=Bursaphelenchus xylophilus TaxID=6326 RepID=A0A1I7S3U4_BURXY|nr:unnamed protein product [Bursaphelenchus xylophilus]CAG9116516.1 unnamed protein product [Bursaphelenchus xylophilus]
MDDVRSRLLFPRNSSYRRPLTSTLASDHFEGMSVPGVVNLKNRDIPVKQVIVYPDRAEVKRSIEVELPVGEVVINVQCLSAVIEKQSIRVEGAQGAKINEVRFEETPKTESNELQEELASLEKEKESFEGQHQTLVDQIHIINKRLEVLDGVASQIGQNVLVNNNEADPRTASSFLLCNEAMSNLTNFLEYYSTSAAELKKELRVKQSQIDALKCDIEQIERHIDQLRSRLEYDNNKRSLRIDVEVENQGRAVIFFTYQVYCAGWKSAYDVRASTSAGLLDSTEDDIPNSVTLHYYGVIEQKTDEDWNDVELILSTATPAFAGSIPSLPTTTVGLQRHLHRSLNYGNLRRPLSGSEEDMGIGSFDYNDCTDAMALQRLTTARSTSEHEINQKDQFPCVCIPIKDHQSVRSDGSPYKVMIFQFELKPVFVHESVPSKSPNAFLSALITNTTPVPFLAGSACIFLNNSFICNHSLHTIMPGEEFRCAFGVDPSVKVECKTPTRSSEQIGFVSKSMLSVHQQTILIRNAKVSEKVQLVVKEPVPKSLDEKIKVSVISPELKTGRSEARLSKDNQLEWCCHLEPGQSKELVLKTSLEFPLNDQLVYNTLSR